MVRRIITSDSPLIWRTGNWFPRFLKTPTFRAELSLQFLAQRELDFFSEEEYRTLQFDKLKKILRHAANTVPYWQKAFCAAGFDSENVRYEDGLSRLPVTTRELVKSLPIEHFLSSATPPEQRISSTTSGSTAEPLLFFQDIQELPRRGVVLLAMHYSRFAKKRPILVLGMTDNRAVASMGKNVSGASIESEKFRKEELYPLLRSYRPSTILGTTSYILRLAHHLKQDQIAIPLHGLIYTGERLRREDHNELERVFKCPIGSIYATKECGAIGVMCREGKYHCLPFLNYVEIVDDYGNSCPENQSGHIAVTFFENRVMPFIRYRIGDEGLVEPTLCPCGRKSKVLTVLGRTPSHIQICGTKMNVRFLEFLLEGYSKAIKKFQIEQPKPDVIVINYMPHTGVLLNEKSAAEVIRIALRNKIGAIKELQISFRRVDDILPDANGKTPSFVNAARKVRGQII